MSTQTFKTSFTSVTSRPEAELRQRSAEERAIAEHKWLLSERLGRDVGMRVAALDYRLNVQPQPDAGEKTHWFLQLLERLAATHGVRAFANAQYTARGGRPFVGMVSAPGQTQQQRRAA